MLFLHRHCSRLKSIDDVEDALFTAPRTGSDNNREAGTQKERYVSKVYDLYRLSLGLLWFALNSALSFDAA